MGGRCFKNPTIEKVIIPEVEDDSDDIDSSNVEPDSEYQPSELDNSSNEEDGPTRMTRYCIRNEWTPNPDGSISLTAGQIFCNAIEVKDVIRRFAIQEGFQLNKLKNDRSRYTVTCLNEDCD
ncbi:hypothetical protein Dsin_021004 [Dipteronia sinensis]|uniref:Transposase MuDR plant domain-containing protein n=1 Tax=Dipteronia sinensis TaxID=43782 RepID=A0AAE0ABI0_9ROSI|nr:hypothetical protein Dsin_021004 [Dipteronia sinensis]